MRGAGRAKAPRGTQTWVLQCGVDLVVEWVGAQTKGRSPLWRQGSGRLRKWDLSLLGGQEQNLSTILIPNISRTARLGSRSCWVRSQVHLKAVHCAPAAVPARGHHLLSRLDG